MKRSWLLVCLAASFVVAACAGTGAPPPATAPQGENRFFVDPRIGAPSPSDASLDRRFDAAWRFFLAGDYTNARARVDDLLRRDANYAPAQVLAAAIDFRQGRTDAARTALNNLAQRYPDWAAPMQFQAEVALADHQTRQAWDMYRTLASRPDAQQVVRERLSDVEKRYFDELYHSALSASDADAIATLRQALIVSPNASGARVLLTQKLIALKQYDDARAALDPLLNSGDADRTDVQESLAEIEVGRGNYEQAIVRYERLARRESDPRFKRRLEQIKEQWNAINMPPQFQRAIASDSLTRADFAVLLYWLVPSVRFAQNVSTPPIATDLADTPGRDEIVRAIALGILQVDPVTRRVGPANPVDEEMLERLVSRVLAVRGAACARGVPSDSIMRACGIKTGLLNPDAPVTGHDASATLQQVANALAR